MFCRCGSRDQQRLSVVNTPYSGLVVDSRIGRWSRDNGKILRLRRYYSHKFLLRIFFATVSSIYYECDIGRAREGRSVSRSHLDVTHHVLITDYQ
jgi:hypothetical protein